MKYAPFCPDPFNYTTPADTRSQSRKSRSRRPPSDSGAIDDHLRHDGYRSLHSARPWNWPQSVAKLFGSPHRRLRTRRISKIHQKGIARERLRCADRRGYPFQTGSSDGSGSLGRERCGLTLGTMPIPRSSRSKSTTMNSIRLNWTGFVSVSLPWSRLCAGTRHQSADRDESRFAE